MKIVSPKHTPVWCAFVCSLTLILSSGFSLAQSPTPCPDYTPPNNPEETLAPDYQPSAYDPGDHTVLHRIRFLPSGPGPTYPTVISIHPGEFRYGDDHGEPHQRMATKDLTDAGFLVFQIEYRLAPQGLLQGQHKHDNTTAGIASGRPPQQTNDVKQEILAALGDPQCNQKIFVIGGSVGHGLWAALDPNPTVPGWDSTTLTKIKAVVGLSNVCDLSLRIPMPVQTFINDVENYTNTSDHSAGYVNRQYLASPISLVAAATNIPPVRLYATELEPVVLHQQSENMATALQAHDPTADVIEYTLPGNEEHAFNYWHDINTLTNPPKCVSQQVIDFFNTYR